MALLDILTYPDERLREKAEPVEEIDDEVRRLAEDMLDTMYAAPSGAGLAAIQVGVPLRVVVYDLSKQDEPDSPQVLINPVIEDAWGQEEEEEGCLSVIDLRAKVKRAETVRAHWLNLQGERVDVETGGFLAILLQHEIDHLNGVLFIDHLSRLKRRLYDQRLRKMNARAADGD